MPILPGVTTRPHLPSWGAKLTKAEAAAKVAAELAAAAALLMEDVQPEEEEQND